MKGWKTIIFSALLFVTGLVKLLAPDAELPSEEQLNVFAENADALIIMGSGIVSGVLRVITTTAIFTKV